MKHPNRRCVIKGAICASLISALHAPAFAQSFPDRPVRFVLPTGAGGTTDQLTRLLGERLSELWKQPVVVENKPGALGNIASRYVASQPADGYTATVASTLMLQALVTMPKTAVGIDEFAPVRQLATVPVVMVVRASEPYRTLADFIAAAKKKPMTYSTDGVGGSKNVYGEILKLDAKFPLTHIPYKAEPPEIQDLLGGVVDAAILGVPAATPFIKAGRLRALAVVGDKRASQLPDVPTFPELGLPRLSKLGWFGVLLPAGTPPDRVNEFKVALDAVMQEPVVTAKIRELGFEILPKSTPEAFASVLRTDYVAWKRLIGDAGIQPNN